MPITRLYHQGSIDTGKTITLDKNASHHLVRVMRNKVGAELILFNGDGFEYEATLLDVNIKNCSVSVNKRINTHRESTVRIVLLQGISRSDKMDSCLQKCTELGVNVIIPVTCEHTTTKLKNERAEKKIKHWRQVIISACEQSGRCIIPELKPVSSYKQAIQSTEAECKLVLNPGSSKGLKDIAPQDDICLLVGPEGGLTEDEIMLAHDSGFASSQLGPRILRTETAGPACIAAIQTLWGDLG